MEPHRAAAGPLGHRSSKPLPGNAQRTPSAQYSTDGLSPPFHPPAVVRTGWCISRTRRRATRYAPFNIRNINGKLYVTFAEQDEDKGDDISGPHHGFVD